MTMTIHRRKLLQLTAAAAGSASLPISLFAQQDFPSQPIKLIVPFTAGSTTDVVARTVGERIQTFFGQPVIVDNRPGAGGTLGASLVAAAAPDGYTALVHSAGHVANAALYPALKYDTLKDFIPITMLATMPNVFVAAPSRGFTSLQDLVNKVKAEPGQFQYGSSGNGSASHIAGEKFRIATGLQVVHVPYRGTPEAINDVMAGRVDWFLLPLALAAPLVAGGKLKALAISAPIRSPLLPDVPTTTEAGFREIDHRFWVGLFLPARTPERAVARLHDETVRALKSDEVRVRFEKLGAQPSPMGQKQFADFVRDETIATRALIKQAGIRIEA